MVFMRKILLFLAVIFSLVVNGQETDLSAVSNQQSVNIGIIPTPQTVYIPNTTNRFTLDNSCKIVLSNDEEISQIINTFKNDIQEITGLELDFAKKKNVTRKQIVFEINPLTVNNSQEYSIDFISNIILISSPTPQGLFYGAQSLKQLIRHQLITENNLNLPLYSIYDYPSLEYRGWMDDISRGPVPTTEFIKEEIRRLAEYKFNFFNLYTEHLFKLENYPDIAPTDGLTAEEIKELTEFAKDYYIEFIGNQQCFAHAEKTLDNPFYDDIKDTRFNFNPGVEETYEFLEELLGETAQAYESKYFNINCDETEGLGNGKAKSYVDNIGSENAYCQHINKVYEILQKYDKDVMMWGDIIAKNPEMIKQLPEDIQFIVWSYGGRDSFDEMIAPFKNSGHDFWIAPGASCWASSFPYIDNYTKNIANFNRDAAKNGAKGVINTAWDDYGETMFNSTWHAMIWCAETSWNTKHCYNDTIRLEHEKIFNKNFNIQYFNVNRQQSTDNSRDVSTTPNNVEEMSLLRLTNQQTTKDYMSNLYELNKLIDESDTRNVMNFQTLNEPLLEFFESQVDSAASAKNNFYKEKSFEIYKALLQDRSELDNNAEIIDMGILAAYRAYVTTLKNELKINLYNTLQNPTEENVNLSKQMSEQLLDSLHLLKKRFVNAWNMESRSYYRNVFTERYDKIAKDILNAGNYVYIQTTDNGQQTTVTLKTIFNDRPIYYTTDGSTPDKNSDVYTEPIEIDRSCIVKAVCFEDNRDVIVNEKYILYHKGMGSFRKLNTVAGNYRPEYSGGGENALLNGAVGSNNYKDGNWQGFYGTDCDIELDFGKKENLNSLRINFITNPYDWILMPNVLKVYTSTNGIDYKLFNTYDIGKDVDKTKATIVTRNIDLSGLSSRYVRIVVETPGLIPEGLPGYNNPSWMFLDEIIVR